MAITRDDIQKAIAKYLPDNLNYSQDASGIVDEDALFSRLLQMMAMAMALDDKSVTYLVYLSIQRLGGSVDAVLALLDGLMSEQQLIAADATDPVLITNFDDLIQARSALISLESDLHRGASISEEKLAFFNTEVDKFLSEQVAQNVESKNIASVRSSLRTSMADLSTAWADMLAKREQVFKIVEEFTSVDIKSIAIQSVLSSSHQYLTKSWIALRDSDADAQGELADDLMVSVAAIKAVIKIITDTPDLAGTVTISPAGSEGEGDLTKTNVEIRGSGDLVPRDYVARSSTGRPFVNYTVGGSKGYAGGSTVTPVNSLQGHIICEYEGPFTFTASAKLLKFTLTKKGSNGRSEEYVVSSPWTPASPVGISASALAAELNGLTDLYDNDVRFTNDSDRLIIFNYNYHGFQSTIKVHNETSDAFTAVLGIETEKIYRGTSNAYMFFDSLMDKTTDARKFGGYCGLAPGADGILSDTHDDVYYLCTKAGQTHRILGVTNSYGMSGLILKEGMPRDKGYDHDVDEGTLHWIITKDRPYGSYVYSSGAMKTPAKIGYPSGETLSTGTHWRSPGVASSGQTGTTVLRKPQNSGSTFNGLGVLGFVVPMVKTQGKAKNCVARGSTGVSAPYQYPDVDTTGYVITSLQYGYPRAGKGPTSAVPQGTHGSMKSYSSTTGEILRAYDDFGKKGFFSGNTGLPAEDVEVGDYLYIVGQGSSPTYAFEDGTYTDWNYSPVGRSFRIYPIHEQLEIASWSDIEASSSGWASAITTGPSAAPNTAKNYFIVMPSWYAEVRHVPGDMKEWSMPVGFGANAGKLYDKIQFRWIDSSRFHSSSTGDAPGWQYGNSPDDEWAGVTAVPGDYIISGPGAISLGNGHDPLIGTAKVFSVMYPVDQRELRLWTKPSGPPHDYGHTAATAAGKDLGNQYNATPLDNFYKEVGDEIDEMWNYTGSASGSYTDSALPDGAQVAHTYSTKYWLMQRGTTEYEVTLPDWWGVGESTDAVDYKGRNPTNDYAWTFKTTHSDVDFTAGRVEVGDRLTIVDASQTPDYAGTAGAAYLEDDWYVYAILGKDRVCIAKNDGTGVAVPPRYYSQSCTWRISKPTYKSIFRDSNADFITNGVEAGMSLVINGTAANNAGTYTIASVDSESQVTITGEFTLDQKEATDWHVLMHARRIYSHEASFTANTVGAGDIVRLYDIDAGRLVETTDSEEEFTVASVTDDFNLVLSKDIKPAHRHFDNAAMMVREKRDASGKEVSNIFMQLDRNYTAGVDFTALSSDFGEVGPTVTHTSTEEDYLTTIRLQSYGTGGAYGPNYKDVGVVALGTSMPLRVQDDYTSGTALDLPLYNDGGANDPKRFAVQLDEKLAVDVGSLSVTPGVGNGFTDATSTSHTAAGSVADWIPYYGAAAGEDEPTAGFRLRIGSNPTFENLPAGIGIGAGRHSFCLWSVFSGLKTNRFIDTSNNLTNLMATGDLLIINPGEEGEERAVVDSVESASLALLKTDVGSDTTTDLAKQREYIDGYTQQEITDLVEYAPGHSGMYDPSDYHTDSAVKFGRRQLEYSVLPNAWPNPGMEFITGNTRIGIKDIKEITNKDGEQVCIELERDLPTNIGKDFNFFVVRAGEDPLSSFFEDDDPADAEGNLIADGFNNEDLSLVGTAIQYYGKKPGKVKISEVISESVLRLDKNVPIEPAGVMYRVVTALTGNTKRLSKVRDSGTDPLLTQALAKDYLTIWTEPTVCEVSSSTQGSLPSGGKGVIEFTPSIPSDRSNLYFTTVTGGPKDYGRFLLLDYLNSRLIFKPDVSDLNLNVAEVIHRRNEKISDVLEPDLSHLAATVLSDSTEEIAKVVGDGDGDTTSSIFDFSAYTSIDSSLEGIVQSTPLRVGDKITVTYKVVGAPSPKEPEVREMYAFAYVTSVSVSGTNQDRVTVSPELPVTSSLTTDGSDLHTTNDKDTATYPDPYSYVITAWKITRNPISYALAEADSLASAVRELRELIDNYTVEPSNSVDRVLDALSENGMDRAISKLLDGHIEDFFQLTPTNASYAAAAKDAIQEIGRILMESSDG